LPITESAGTKTTTERRKIQGIKEQKINKNGNSFSYLNLSASF
jgi:hypothetical protein